MTSINVGLVADPSAPTDIARRFVGPAPRPGRRLPRFVASAATVGGALGTGLESDDAIRRAAYSKREEERRHRLAGTRS